MGSWLAIANAKAGTSDEQVIESALGVLRTQHDVELVETEDSDDLEAALRRVETGGTVVVMGGDGSLHAVVAVLDRIGRLGDVVLALLPLGTGNDFARTLGIERDSSVGAAAMLLTSVEGPIDVVRDDTARIAVNAVHVGLGAEAAVEAKPWKDRFGRVGYAVGAVVSGVRHRGFLGRVTVDGEPLPHAGRIIQVAVGNGRYVGGGAPLLPEADPADGLLDVAVSWSNPRLKRIGYAWRLRKGRHPQRDDVTYLRARTVSVTGEPVRGNIDGEICEPATTHTWHVEPAALRMLRPLVEDRVEPSN